MKKIDLKGILRYFNPHRDYRVEIRPNRDWRVLVYFFATGLFLVSVFSFYFIWHIEKKIIIPIEQAGVEQVKSDKLFSAVEKIKEREILFNDLLKERPKVPDPL